MTKKTLSLSPSSFDDVIKLLTAIGAVGSFFWGIWVWRDKSNKEIYQAKVEAERLAESRRIEATKPFLERQLRLYTEASQVTAKIATSTNEKELADAKKRFWQLYWGELALVENQEVEAAMVKLGRALEHSSPQNELIKQLSLKLAHACRKSLDLSWGIQAWSHPDSANVRGRIDINTKD